MGMQQSHVCGCSSHVFVDAAITWFADAAATCLRIQQSRALVIIASLLLDWLENGVVMT
jgi:hypothetical protein